MKTRKTKTKAIKSQILDYTHFDLAAQDHKDSEDFFENGWGRRGHLSTLIIPVGVGNSLCVTQCAYCWALGFPGVVGGIPERSLRVAIVNSEDDDNEIAEICKDVRSALVSADVTEDAVKEAERQIFDFSLAVGDTIDSDFLERLDAALASKSVDIVVVNTLNSRTDFSTCTNHQALRFLDRLTEVAKRRNVMLCAVVNHCGSMLGCRAVLWNSSRSVTVIECTPSGLVEVVGAKRGDRLGWMDADGKRTNRKLIAYSEKKRVYLDECVRRFI